MCKLPFPPVVAVALLAALALPARAASDDFQWAEDNYRAGRYADAAKNLEKVLAGQAEAEKTAARRLLARVQLTTGRYAEAEKLFAAVPEPGAEDLNLIG